MRCTNSCRARRAHSSFASNTCKPDTCQTYSVETQAHSRTYSLEATYTKGPYPPSDTPHAPHTCPTAAVTSRASGWHGKSA